MDEIVWLFFTCIAQRQWFEYVLVQAFVIAVYIQQYACLLLL